MPTLKVNFKSPAKASEFTKNFGVVGVKATTKIDGSTVTITTADDKAHEFVKHMVADLKSEAKMESTIANFLSAIIEASESGVAKDAVLFDGSTISVEPSIAEAFVRTHDSMEEEFTQKMLCALAVESADSFKNTANFVSKKAEEEQE